MQSMVNISAHTHSHPLTQYNKPDQVQRNWGQMIAYKNGEYKERVGKQSLVPLVFLTGYLLSAQFS